MKRPIILLCLILSAPIFAQSSKSIEVIKDPSWGLDRTQEEQAVRKEWDREEEQAQATEERQRDMDEKRAEEGPAPIIIEGPSQSRPKLKGYGIQ